LARLRATCSASRFGTPFSLAPAHQIQCLRVARLARECSALWLDHRVLLLDRRARVAECGALVEEVVARGCWALGVLRSVAALFAACPV